MPRPGPTSLAHLKRQTKRLMVERLARRRRQQAKKLGLSPLPPPKPVKPPKPSPIVVTPQQIARQKQQVRLRAAWDAMAEAGVDRLQPKPRPATRPPTWAGPPATPPLPPLGAAWSAGSASTRISAPPPPKASPVPPRAPRNDRECAAFDRVMQAERERVERVAQTDRAVALFTSRLTPRQIAAGIGCDFDPFCVAEHYRLYGGRGDRRFWR